MTLPKQYCNVLALEKGLDPAGHAGSFNRLLLLEAPLPWRKEMYDTAGTLPTELIALRQLIVQRYYETGEMPSAQFYVIAPDEVYSRAGWRRVLLFERGAKAIAHFARTEYHVPEALAGPLVWALAEEPERVAEFEAYRTAVSPTLRDLLVCNHGTVDAACAKFGFPLYRTLRQKHAHDDLRVWRVSHFGGHVFAPTMLDMPTGHYWAYVGEEQAVQIAKKKEPTAALHGHYRGWAGLGDSFLQVAERELFCQMGWAWIDRLKYGEIIAREETAEPTWAEVRLVVDEGANQRSYEARVELGEPVSTPYNSAEAEVYAYPQYRVVTLQPADPAPFYG